MAVKCLRTNYSQCILLTLDIVMGNIAFVIADFRTQYLWTQNDIFRIRVGGTSLFSRNKFFTLKFISKEWKRKKKNGLLQLK